MQLCHNNGPPRTTWQPRTIAGVEGNINVIQGISVSKQGNVLFNDALNIFEFLVLWLLTYV